jgi:molecular chaperone Hsp33
MPLPDRIIRAYLPQQKLQLIFVSATELSRHGAEIQKAYPTAASLFAQTLTAGLLLGALQTGDARLNLQIECDGPIKGLFADAKRSGEVRGYIKNGQVDFPGLHGPFRANGALGRKGYVSVLRDINGEVYRGAVDLEAKEGAANEIADLLGRYFDQSEQVQTGIALTVRPQTDQPLGEVAGLLIQALPDGDREALVRAITALREGFFDRAELDTDRLPQLLSPLFGGEVPQIVDTLPAVYKCGCSRDRALRAIAAMGREEIADLWEKEGKAEATCEFCAIHYVIPGEELLGLIFPANQERN